jgi:hypothetical protein
MCGHSWTTWYLFSVNNYRQEELSLGAVLHVHDFSFVSNPYNYVDYCVCISLHGVWSHWTHVWQWFSYDRIWFSEPDKQEIFILILTRVHIWPQHCFQILVCLLCVCHWTHVHLWSQRCFQILVQVCLVCVCVSVVYSVMQESHFHWLFFCVMFLSLQTWARHRSDGTAVWRLAIASLIAGPHQTHSGRSPC